MQHMDDDAGFRPVRHALCQHHASTRPTSKQANHAEPPVPKLHTNLHQMNMRQNYLTPILGPSAVMLLHRMARYLTGEGITVATLSIEDMAASLGLTVARFKTTVARLAQFGMIRSTPTTIHVRMMVPPLPARWLDRMPAFLADNCPYKA